MNLPAFKIGNLEVNLLQGPMGVGVSGKNLVSVVANCGGAGIIASVELGLLKGYTGNRILANREALRDEIRAARKMTNGVLGLNVMYALTDSVGLIKVGVEEGIDFLTSGAGIDKDFPKTVGNNDIHQLAIVNGLRSATIITKAWGRYGKVPDAFIVEGPKAGGHLGYSYDDLVNGTALKLEDIARPVIEFANDPKNFKKPVPVIVAGGVYTGKDILYYQNIGASGVQMATRFVTTKECDASDKFKRMYIDATEDDIIIISSPVGMPGRVIKTSLSNMFTDEKMDFSCLYNCLKTCDPLKSRYCIAEALVNAHRGNVDDGIVFAGANAYRAMPDSCLDEFGNFITVETLMKRITEEYFS